MDALTALLSERDWILADGATGTALTFALPDPRQPVELLNLTAPDVVAANHEAATLAGADLILTNSFGANLSRLRLAGADAQLAEINRAAARIAREAADRAGRRVVVAGSIGPSGEIMAPMGALSHADAVAMFHEQALALQEGGVDMLWFETLSAAEELRAAAEAALLTGLPWAVTMSFEMAGRTMMGVTPARLAALVEQVQHKPIAFGANCGLGAADNLRAIAGFAASGSERPLIAKGNAGIAHHHHGRLEYDGTPALMGDYAALARDLGCRIIGGCCGTTPAHLAEMRAALTTRPRGPRPSLEQITEAVGSFTG
ncbi:MAG: betaine--homocysteine S-methyltransferase [Paracoccus sp. (in: a-proteobacteria)]|nr:betaine--homocysteine S-methyltransferase [Paracoccus sp. (in: a-proteobacteria)]